MKSVKKPKNSADATFTVCISKVKNPNLKQRLKDCISLIIAAELEFSSKISKGEIYTIMEEVTVNGNVSVKELKKVYTTRMAKKGAPGRDMYNKLFSAPALGICPICMHRPVETLDHYLPKTKFPRLTVTPINLIPTCNACNKIKLAESPKKPEDESLHPYFDNVENEQWLKAKVKQSKPPTIKFYVEPPREWDELLKKRTIKHFDSFKLNNVFKVQSAVEMSNINLSLKNAYEKSGAQGVKEYLQGEADSRFNADKNSWRTALYQAIANDSWFYNGGFQI